MTMEVDGCKDPHDFTCQRVKSDIFSTSSETNISIITRSILIIFNVLERRQSRLSKTFNIMKIGLISFEIDGFEVCSFLETFFSDIIAEQRRVIYHLMSTSELQEGAVIALA